MIRYLLMTLLFVGSTNPVWSQQASDPVPPGEVALENQAAQQEDQASEEDDASFDGDDAFSPTEEIKVDSAVSFPVDI